MVKSKVSKGFVTVLVLFIISICVMLITAIVNKSFIFQRKVSFDLEREKAKLLALSGLEFANDQISFVMTEKEKKNDAKGKNEKDNEKKNDKEKENKSDQFFNWLSKFLKAINNWQTVNLTEENSGISGTIHYYISAENGKINLSQIWAAIKHEENKKKEIPKNSGTKDEPKKKTYVETIKELIQKELNFDIISSLKEVKKKLGRLPEDPTELLLLSNTKKVKDFLFNFSLKSSKQIFLMDLFTIWYGSGRLNPWCLSRSMAQILGMRISSDVDTENIISKAKEGKKLDFNWVQDWDKLLAPMYGKNFSSIEEEVRNMFAPRFELSAISVTSYAKVGKATERLYALLLPDKEAGKKSKLRFKIAKIYWL